MVCLSALWQRGPVVLYFYPKDETPGCTAEACTFRDGYQAFADVEVVDRADNARASYH